METVDIAVVGAGPVGLALTALMAGSGRTMALIEQQPACALTEPAFDGREIALTHASRQRLEAAGIWQAIGPEAIWPLRQARVRDRSLPFALDVDNAGKDDDPLGWLVSNWRIRQAAWLCARANADCDVLDGVGLNAVQRKGRQWELTLSEGRVLQASTVIAADSRFSATRRMLGVGARSHDHGTAMVVRQVSLERDHHCQAWEWFGEGCTRALLPLQPGVASAVVTLPMGQARGLLAADDADYANQVSTLFGHRWGSMRPLSTAHLYPMVTVYADRFAGPGFALAGDAAVGMHPVTAHGFNFGIRSATELATVLRQHPAGPVRDAALMHYARGHRRATLPLFTATAMVAGLYSDMRLPARMLRGGALALASSLPPFRSMLRRHLTGTA